jgi:hypothetical protein
MDPESSAEFTTNWTSAEPSSTLCKVLPSPTEVTLLLGVTVSMVPPAGLRTFQAYALELEGEFANHNHLSTKQAAEQLESWRAGLWRAAPA